MLKGFSPSFRPLIICSGGIPEALDEEGEQLGYERTAQVVRKTSEKELSAAAIIDVIVEAVEA